MTFTERDAARPTVGDDDTRGRKDFGYFTMFRVRMAGYRIVAGWFWRDAFVRFWGKSVTVLVFSVLSIGFLLLALGKVLAYARALENGSTIEFLGYSVIPRQSMTLLMVVAIGACGSFALSFGFRYAGKIKALSLGRSYEEFCAKRAIALLANHGGHPEAREWVDSAGKALQGDPRYCGRVARITIGIVLPVLTFLGTFAMLLWLDARLTIIVLILMGGALPILYAINVKGARHSVAMENYAKPAGKAKQELLELAAKGDGQTTPHSPEIEKAFAKGPIARHLDAYVGRLRASDNSELLTNILMGLGLAIILAVKGAELLAYGQGWSELASFMIALRFNLQSATQASKILTGVNRFYPQVGRHCRFVRGLEGLPVAPAATVLSSAIGDLEDNDDENE